MSGTSSDAQYLRSNFRFHVNFNANPDGYDYNWLSVRRHRIPLIQPEFIYISSAVHSLYMFSIDEMGTRTQWLKTKCHGQNVKCHGQIVTDKMSRTKCHGQNATDKMSRTKCHGQNATDKMPRTKCHRQNATDKMSRTKCHGQNATDKMVHRPKLLQG